CGRYRYLGLIARYLAVDYRYHGLSMCLVIPQIGGLFSRSLFIKIRIQTIHNHLYIIFLKIYH
ncbi:hypothetical protein, partial [Proteus sp. G2663]|uniref:hypothetical protein n=1 Tax=Proteus sp. G2663 TaxID=2698876 RepID=UPI001F3184EE